MVCDSETTDSKIVYILINKNYLAHGFKELLHQCNILSEELGHAAGRERTGVHIKLYAINLQLNINSIVKSIILK